MSLHLSCRPILRNLKITLRSPWSLFSSRLNNQLSQYVSIADMVHPSDDLGDPSLDSLQQIHVLPVMGSPKVDVALQVWSYESRVEGQNHFACPAGCAALVEAQDMI